MRKTIFLVVQLFVIQQLCAQPIHKKAERHFNQFEYISAAHAYEKILQENADDKLAMERLVLCYDKLNDPQRAEEWLARICNREQAEAKYLKMYGQVLAANSKYAESKEWYKKYLAGTSDKDVEDILTGYEKLSAFYKDSSLYSIAPLDINSQHSDFSPVFYEDGILFCSARGSGKKASQYAWNNSSFIDLYYSTKSNPIPVPIDKPVNSKLHEGPATFSIEQDTIYFTRNNYVGNRKVNSSDGIVKLKIYFSIKNNETWLKERSFKFNSNEYSTGHPAFSPDHKLYFVSDRPGGFGGTDIYWTKYENGDWVAPVNLGAEINTSGNEMFPYVDSSGNLYFASNTHPGLGGLDIFCAKINQNGFSPPENMGAPVNSSKDDFGLIIQNNKGYFSSNRGDNPQDDNIFSFSLDKTKLLAIQAVTTEGLKIENFTIQIIRQEQVLKEQLVESTFTHSFNVDDSYTVSCSKEGFLNKSRVLQYEDFVKVANNETVTVILDRAIKKVTLALLSVEGTSIANGNIQIKELATGTVRTFESDKDGLLSIELDPQAQYEIVCAKTNYKTKTISLNPTDLEKITSETNVPIVLSLANVLFDKNEIGQLIELDIKYDLGKFNIRKDAAKELDKLIVFLKKNPTVSVELGSHTDSRGGQESNLALSQKRATSAAHYIVTKGISSKRVIPIGYGKDDLKVIDAVTEEEHQQNRRTTVKIVGI
jgi:outer membrane protein OmpA-like peptidoglycan-associated protein